MCLCSARAASCRTSRRRRRSRSSSADRRRRRIHVFARSPPSKKESERHRAEDRRYATNSETSTCATSLSPHVDWSAELSPNLECWCLATIAEGRSALHFPQLKFVQPRRIVYEDLLAHCSVGCPDGQEI